MNNDLTNLPNLLQKIILQWTSIMAMGKHLLNDKDDGSSLILLTAKLDGDIYHAKCMR